MAPVNGEAGRGSRGSAGAPAGLGQPEPVQRVKASEHVIAKLRSSIASETLTPGTKLPSERELAAHYGVSQPTIREAVRALETLGLVEIRHGSGTYVSGNRQQFITNAIETLLQMQRAPIVEVFGVRRALGVCTAETASAAIPPETVEAMADARERIRTADTVPALCEAIIDFQILFSSAGGNALLTALESVLIRILIQIQAAAHAGNTLDSWRVDAMELDDHRGRVVELLRGNDADGARRAWIDYLDAQAERFEKDPDLASVTLDQQAAIDALRDFAVRNNF